MQQKVNNFTSEFNHFMQKKENKMLREKINPLFKHERNIDKLIDFVAESTMQPETRYHYAKFKMIEHLKKMDKNFHEAAVTMAVYSEENDDIYWINYSTSGEKFFDEYYKTFGTKEKLSISFDIMRTKKVAHVDYTNPIENKDVAKFMVEQGFLSVWYIPVQLEGVLIGCVCVAFKKQIGRLPDEAELNMIRSELDFLEDELRIIITKYEGSQNVDIQRKVGR